MRYLCIDFRGKEPLNVFLEWKSKYGDVFTYWMGSKPVVVLASNSVIVEAFGQKSREFGDRPRFQFEDLTKRSPDTISIALSKTSNDFMTLKNVAHAAVRKYATNPNLPLLEVTVIDETLNKMMQYNEPFNPVPMFDRMIFAINAAISSGKNHSIDDPTIGRFIDTLDRYKKSIYMFLLVEFVPILKWTLFRKRWKRVKEGFEYVIDWCMVQLDSRGNSVEHRDGAMIESEFDFKDALLSARKKAIASDSKFKEVLNISNLSDALLTLFLGGTDSTGLALCWAFLFLSKYQDIQERLRNEIDSIIGDAVPNQDHRIQCHYVRAFISEVLRSRPFIPFGVPHMTTMDTSVGGKPIPAMTEVVALLIHQMAEPGVWKDPNTFNPDRFLDASGKYLDVKIEGFNPFSIGKRACIGEKLATVTLFIAIARILQKTKGYTFVLENADKFDESPDPAFHEITPRFFEVSLRPL